MPTSPRNRLKNSAFVFIKPHAHSDAVKTLVHEKLKSIPSLTILAEIDLAGSRINSKKILDVHYYGIAKIATLTQPCDLPNFPEGKFNASFSETWKEVKNLKRAVNSREARSRFSCTGSELAAAWKVAEKDGRVFKLSPDISVGLISVNHKEPLYVFNGFFSEMRDKYIGEDAVVHGYDIEWDANECNWKDFRSGVVGCKDPGKAEKGSLRREIFDRYKELGLSSPPDTNDNCIHASASPLEGIAEKKNWMSKQIIDDKFGRALLSQGLTQKLLVDKFFKNPDVDIPNQMGKKGSLFALVEDMDAKECLDNLISVYDLQLLNMAKKGNCVGKMAKGCILM
mmetsp:Transcript_8621/g.12529  ORF Transcript_8621/g.12529 Transcript_8621/m.12529 type:complete len:340 (-) Transcript_8621:166-1185(-)|eukprot:CAMPEP_0195526462 /NCGR_PEP_ID=MMETSP0794_2-20130614/27535_1 /TAXON_ID=515487 /ORGANISM="Stephanopyxis turris, Strain CCMP 815" /LENGTH=339 /DNA_ID=CAMNT_0040657151 /DNA_START=152 /DNA_END=1171 /DNA_ORIENTATION=+